MNNLTPEHQILHEKFKQYGANAREWMRKCVLLLPEIERYRIWEKKGFGSMYEYAAKLAGMSRNTVDDALRILRKIEDKPELQKVVTMKGINAIRPVAAIATKETEGFWAEKARIMSKHTLEIYVKELYRTGTENVAENSHQQGWSTESPKKTIAMQLDPEIAEQLEKLKGQGDWNELMKQFLGMRAAELTRQKPEPVKTESRRIPVKIQKHALARTNGACSFPGCKKPYEIIHHTQRFALEKVHDPERLEPLCKVHERLVHLGLIENEELSANQWQVRVQPDKNKPTYKIDELVAKYRS